MKERLCMNPYKEWLDFARSSYNYARASIDIYVRYSDRCYQAQQAVEKAFKALLIYYGVEPEFTHNISVLIKELENHVEVSEEIKESQVLTTYAVETRYPGLTFDINEQEFQRALDIAKRCIEWVVTKIEDNN